MAGVPKALPTRLSHMSVGQTMLFGSSIVAASLGGFYWNLRRIHNKKVQQGALPHYEYLLAHVASRGLANPVPGAAELPLTRIQKRGNILPGPQREHHSAHSTVANFKPSSTSSEIRGRLEQPTPQRPKEVGSSAVYTKSPDYVKSYEKIGQPKNKNAIPSLVQGEVPEVLGASPSP